MNLCDTCKWMERLPADEPLKDGVVRIDLFKEPLCLNADVADLVTGHRLYCSAARYEVQGLVHVPGMLCGGRKWEACA